MARALSPPRFLRPLAVRLRGFLLGDVLREFAEVRATSEAEGAVLRARLEAAEVALVGLRQVVELGRDRVLEETNAARATLAVLEERLELARAEVRAAPSRLDRTASALERAVLTLAVEPAQSRPSPAQSRAA